MNNEKIKVLTNEKIKTWAKRVIKGGPDMAWYKDGSAVWIFYNCNEPDKMKRLFKALHVFNNFKPTLFGFSMYSYKAIEGIEFVKVKEPADIEKFSAKESRANNTYGIIKIKNINGEEKWLDGVEFYSSNRYDNSLVINLYRDDWYIGDVSLDSLRDFNAKIKELKRILKPKETDMGTGHNFLFNDLYDEKQGFVIDEIINVREGRK